MIYISGIIYGILLGIIIKLARKKPADGVLLIQFDDDGNKHIKLSIDRIEERENGDILTIDVQKEQVENFDWMDREDYI